MTLKALQLRKESKEKNLDEDIDMTVAGETVISMGIFSLVIGAAIGGLMLMSDMKTRSFAQFSNEDWILIAYPFIEGLISSALSALLGNHLRHQDFVVSKKEDMAGSASGFITGVDANGDPLLGIDPSKLRAEVEQLSKAVANGTSQMQEWQTHMEEVNETSGDIVASMKPVTVLLSEVAKLLVGMDAFFVDKNPPSTTPTSQSGTIDPGGPQ